MVRASVCHMETSLSTLKTVRDAFVAMDRPLSVNKLSVQLFNELLKAAPIRDRATTTEIQFGYNNVIIIS